MKNLSELVVTSTLVVMSYGMYSEASYARVESILLEKVVSKGDQKFSQVAVKCAGKVKKRRMLKESISSAAWCAESNTGQCSYNKYELARAMCENKAQVAILNKQPSPAILKTTNEKPAEADSLESPNSSIQTTRIDDLLSEQIIIEEQRILIEQKRLELSKQEIDLKRQRATLER